MEKEYESLKQQVLETGKMIDIQILIGHGLSPIVECKMNGVTSADVSKLFIALNELTKTLKKEYKEEYMTSKFIRYRTKIEEE